MAQFRAKARAVDLLGKGQIADLPTAISELWKNGYDAYGDKLEAYLYMKGYQNQSETVFVLSDDGKGMSREDILDKWFVLGTDSKSHHIKDKKGSETLGKEPRVKMGEKGIGRLAVAYLGPQMIMLTKKLNHPLEIVFFDWRILENFDLFISDINVPVKSIDSLSHFQSSLASLKEDFLLNFPKTKEGTKDPWQEQKELKQIIINDCKNMTFPGHLVEEIVKGLLDNVTQSHGTRFVIFQPETQLLDLKNFVKNDEAKETRDDVSVNYTVSTLTGLFNVFKDENTVHKTFFWIVDENGKYDLLKAKSFFKPNDFNQCDHLIDGKFDENGNFKGTVRIYNKEINHTFKPIRKLGETQYGPFSIKLGYVQEEDDKSIIPEEKKRQFEQQLELYSGLFLYRDNFRVLPYGRPDNDFLEFEERRSRRVGSYFFSKRRMFGYIDITRENNEKLRDKSSREGLINNVASRDFKVDLISFFIDLAKKYFSDKAQFDYKESQQKELQKLALAEEQEKQREVIARKEFAQKLNKLPSEIDIFHGQFIQLTKDLEQKVNDSDVQYSEIQDILTKIQESKIKLNDFKLPRPTRFKPTDLQKKNLNFYNKKYQIVEDSIQNSDNLINIIRNKLKVHELFNEFENKNLLYKNKLINQFSEFDSELNLIFIRIGNEFRSEKETFLTDFSSKYTEIIPAKTNAKEISRSLKLLESIFDESFERINNRIKPYLEHLQRTSFDVNEDDLVGYYKMQFEEMKNEWNKTYELAQLGIAVEIIDHQFNTLYSQLAENIKSMESYLLNNKESKIQYNILTNAFEHLEDNYKLLQPLYRTTGRIRKNITGKELSEYIGDFFKSRFEENKINFHITREAEKWTVYSYESIFKPVLINIINNAIYWLQPVKNREIRIDVKDNRLLIMNSGVSIDETIEKEVFKLFYSERPKGRGIGLYLAKKSLNGIGFDIEASNDKKYNILQGASFIIFPLK